MMNLCIQAILLKVYKKNRVKKFRTANFNTSQKRINLVKKVREKLILRLFVFETSKFNEIMIQSKIDEIMVIGFFFY